MMNGVEQLDEGIIWHNPLPQQHWQARVQCRYSFSPTKWAIRQLTIFEMMLAYDIPKTVGPPTLKLKLFPREETSVPFLGQAPLRILQAVLEDMGTLRASIRPVKTKGSEGLGGSNLLPPAWPANVAPTWRGASSAVKSDSATAVYAIWDTRVWQTRHYPAEAGEFQRRYHRDVLETLRHLMLRMWRRRVLKSLLKYLTLTLGPGYGRNPNARRDFEVGRDCLVKAAGATWFEWSMGSTPFFWRWGKDSQTLIRDGHPPWMRGPPPCSVKPQRTERDPRVRQMVHEKLHNVFEKGYISPGDVLILTSYFAVPKGDSDIRMVYDASASGLNKCLWAPSFSLPSSDTLLDLLTPDSWMGDMDMGEQFLNFHLHEDLQPYCGIDVRPFFDHTRKTTLWL